MERNLIRKKKNKYRNRSFNIINITNYTTNYRRMM